MRNSMVRSPAEQHSRRSEAIAKELTTIGGSSSTTMANFMKKNNPRFKNRINLVRFSQNFEDLDANHGAGIGFTNNSDKKMKG